MTITYASRCLKYYFSHIILKIFSEIYGILPGYENNIGDIETPNPFSKIKRGNFCEDEGSLPIEIGARFEPGSCGHFTKLVCKI